MLYQILGDLVLLVHLLFIIFVVLGGLLVLKRGRLVMLHLPAVSWGIFIEFSGRICPLTPLENYLRKMAGREGYSGTFIEHYLVPLIYPPGLTSTLQIVLGLVVLVINVSIYAILLRRCITRGGKNIFP
jgi:hypothetical protein